MEKFTFFWKSDSPFSQWYPSLFTVDGITYNCAEQYMMHRKADWKTAREVLSAKKPSEQKKLGRQVRNFDDEIWREHRFDIVKTGNTEKFTQNSDLKEILLRSTGTTLVEASPRDQIWGIGLSAESKEVQSRETWRGMNLLGEALTRVREEMIKHGEVDAAECDDIEKTRTHEGEEKTSN